MKLMAPPLSISLFLCFAVSPLTLPLTRVCTHRVTNTTEYGYKSNTSSQEALTYVQKTSSFHFFLVKAPLSGAICPYFLSI